MWESVFPLRQSTMRGEYGLPHQPAGWFAMTERLAGGAAGIVPHKGTVVFLFLLLFFPFCGILGLYHFKIKEFSPWKP